ncbi:MAG: solute-binding protein, partial [Acidimicrobiaceae bacterium]|nr:solute-binding protein [Acidimicrobiaceae bacterium]
MTLHRSARKVVPVLLSAGMVATGAGVAGVAGATARPHAATVSATTFNRSFTTMSLLKAISAKGKGKVAAILPDTVSSARYSEFDAPYLKEAMQKAGLPAADIIVQNAQGSDATQLADAQADIAKGATVLIMDPLDSGVGTKIESYAKSHGAQVVDYDRLDLGGSR